MNTHKKNMGHSEESGAETGIISRIDHGTRDIYMYNHLIALLIYSDSAGKIEIGQQFAHVGERIFLGALDTKLSYGQYSRLMVYRLAYEPRSEWVAVCDGESFKTHDSTKIALRHVEIFQTLGDTNVHVIQAVVDDRLRNVKFIRLLAVGLMPGPGEELYCMYDCPSPPVERCSVKAQYAMLAAGNQSDYPKYEWKRKSMMNVNVFACPLRNEDNPKAVTMVTRSCGYSHNMVSLSHLDLLGVQVPQRDVAVCVHVVNQSLLPSAYEDPNALIMWVEYLTLMGIDKIFMYHAYLGEKNQKVVKQYKNELLSDIEFTDWNNVTRNLDHVVASEAGINHCLYKNLMLFHNIIVMTVEDWLIPGDGIANIKQVVRSTDFHEDMDNNIGFRIHSTKMESREHTSKSFVVRPRKVLAFSANHFIPLSEKVSFQYLKSGYFSMTSFEGFQAHSMLDHIRAPLAKQVAYRLKRSSGT
ncbi:uncharacterized protein LOC106163325 isoform X2 [Lingula anatina]|uniref:Glycosyltransferase family 92 protein n=1 Tax=Lingula anatina TaxID=7574 RepID=A0A1S3IDV3_LINAN|nr:uncharacterized protein LOC106163325 isoform X2 [Lingula anatina]|eukprot:XP_013396338.1 uncharacterized protein LOC106163325 isoform X2 [Lingula anatina]